MSYTKPCNFDAEGVLMRELISPEEARELVLSQVSVMEVQEVDLLDCVSRVAAADIVSDSDVSPFAHSAMDGFGLRAEDIACASEESPVQLRVIAEIGAGDYYDGPINEGECIRIMTGAALPESVDSVVKYEIVDVVEGDGKTGSTVAFKAPTKHRSNVREAGEEAHAGDVIVRTGEVISAAGIGFLASCGAMRVPTYKRPRVAVIATGSELVDPHTVPGPGKIRNSNSYAIAACVAQAGAIPYVLPIVEDTYEALRDAVADACEQCDFVITTGGAANGDYDFIKKVVSDLGELMMSTVNMRPGKAQTFGMVHGVPVFGLPGNPAAAYVGFHILIRPALRKMQGFSHFDHTKVWARLTDDARRRDPRRIYLRSTIVKDEQGYSVTPAKNQSSGLFGVIQRSNCLVILPEEGPSLQAGDSVECLLLDIPEELIL